MPWDQLGALVAGATLGITYTALWMSREQYRLALSEVLSDTEPDGEATEAAVVTSYALRGSGELS